MKFITCYPDANSFKEIIKIKKPDEWNVEYVPLTNKVGYWIGDNPFHGDGFELYKKLINCFPVVKNNNDHYCKDPNPFATIHLPLWATKEICELIKDFYLNHINGYGKNGQINEWGNLYRKDARPIKAFQIPHIDYEQGLIGNLWLSNNEPGTTGTNIFEYSGKFHELFYDFQVDPKHPLYEEYKTLNYRLDKWENFTDEEADKWGFKKLGTAPCIEGKIVMYKTNQPHAPYISDSVDFRWAHAYAFYCEPISVKGLL
jgi:hypothetical protein